MDRCQICDLVFSEEYPKVSLNGCDCRICVYCAFGCLCTNNCIRCKQRECTFFIMEEKWSNERLMERKNEFLEFYMRLNNEDPSRYTLSVSQN